MNDFSPFSLRPASVVPVWEAHIATDIKAHLNDGVEESIRAKHSVTIYVIGHDLPNLMDLEYESWRDLLSKWIRMGVNVQYVALDDKQSVLGNLTASRDLLVELSSHSDGGLQMFLPKLSSEIDQNRGRLLEALRNEYTTFHFVLAIDETDETQSQMWIEGNHQPKSKIAFDCYYFPKGDAARSPEFSQHRRNFEFLKSVSELAF